MVSAMHPPESVCICSLLLKPPSPPHPFRLSQSTSLGFPVSHGTLLLAIYFTYGNVYVSMFFSQIIPSASSLAVSKSLFFMSASPLSPCK